MRWLDSTRDARKACELKQSFIDWKRPPHATESMRANSKKPQRGADHDLFCKVRGHEALSDDLRGLFTVVEELSALWADSSISDVPDASPTASSHPQVCQRELGHGLCPSPVRSSAWGAPSAWTIPPTLDRLQLVIDEAVTRMPHLPQHHLPAATHTP
jgi:hypothetical protein